MNEGAGRVAPIRVVVQHFALPRYRVAVFQELAKTPGLDVTIAYGAAPGLDNVEAGGVRTQPSRIRRFRLAFGSLLWDTSQWSNAHPRRADVLVLTWNVRSLTLVPALVRAKRRGVRTLLWGHGYSRRDSAVRRMVRRAVARLADGVIFYGHRDAARFTKATGRIESTFVALNGLDQRPIQAARDRLLSDTASLAAFSQRPQPRRSTGGVVRVEIQTTEPSRPTHRSCRPAACIHIESGSGGHGGRYGEQAGTRRTRPHPRRRGPR